MFDWKRTPHLLFFVLALFSMVCAVLTEGDIFWGDKQDKVVNAKTLFYALAIICFGYGVIYRFSHKIIYSKRWIWFHLTSVMTSLLIVFIVQYNSVQLLSLYDGNVEREPFDDLLYLRVQHWSRGAFLTLLAAQLILPANLLLGWCKYRSDIMLDGGR